MIESLVTKIGVLLGFNEHLFVYQVVEFLGNLNTVLVILAVSLFLLRRVNKHQFQNKNATIKKIVKPLSKIHPVIGILLLLSAFLHGSLALGTIFKIHTGPLAWWVLLLMMLVAMIGKKFKIKNWLTVHRVLAVLMVVSVLLHLSVRNLLG